MSIALWAGKSVADAPPNAAGSGVLNEVWPVFGLVVVTPRLELRLPREGELARLAGIAGEGVHHPGERPFLTPWTEGTPQERARSVVQGHWSDLGSWSTGAWTLRLGVFRGTEPLGIVALRARDFQVVREVATWSWLGIGNQGQGYGTEARTGLLTLAFDHLGAQYARTEVFQDNHASQAVSRKLGYEPDGISVDARGTEALISDRLRLTRERWAEVDRQQVTVKGVAECRDMFGAPSVPE
jgi:RimJ/RimL family protein N-acetyltransferase